MLGADVVQVLEDAAQHEFERAVDAQTQHEFGKGLEDTPDGLVHYLVDTLDELVDELFVVAAALIALGKGDIGLGNGLLQIFQQQTRDGLGRFG